MELWESEFEWLRIRHHVKDAMQQKELPDLQTILFLIGMQEVSIIKHQFTKEEKQDMMHVAVCTLMSIEGYYEFKGRDADGWPHFNQVREIPFEGPKAQESYLKKAIVYYFDNQETTSLEGAL